MQFLACSGPGAGALMEQNQLIGVISLLILGIIILVMLGLQSTGKFNSKIALGVCLAMFVVHPLWTLGVRHGDCGNPLRWVALTFTFMAVSAFIMGVLKAMQNVGEQGDSD